METSVFKSKTRNAGHLQTTGRQLSFNNNNILAEVSSVRGTKYDDLFSAKSTKPKSKISNENLEKTNYKYHDDEEDENVNVNNKRNSMYQPALTRNDDDSDKTDDDSDDDNQKRDNNINIYPIETETETESKQIKYKSQYFDLISKDMIEFVKAVPDLNETVRCKVFVKRSVFKEFYFNLEYPNGSHLLLMQSSRKKNNLNIFFWIDVCYYTNPASIVRFGRLSSNFSRMSFILIGDLSQQQFQSDSDDLDNPKTANTRKYLDVDYLHKMLGKPKPKDINVEVLIPNDFNENRTEENNSVEKLFKKKASRRMNLTTKKPIYDPVSKKYKLDFKGRAQLASSNNIQLIDDNDNIIFQLGKYKKKCYNCDFTYPMSAFQAFSIAIACLSRT